MRKPHAKSGRLKNKIELMLDPVAEETMKSNAEA
jgi:hypothetical protein